MRSTVCRLFLFLIAAGLYASEGLDEAMRAKALLGPGLWSTVIEVENHAHGSRYPAQEYALVFEFERLLWFYTDTDGTHRLSMCAGCVDHDKANLGPLIRALDPDFGAWKILPDGPHLMTGRGHVRNGCLIESIALLRRSLVQGADITRPKLLFYYVETRSGLHGHAVLEYESGGSVAVVDPDFPRHTWHLSASAAGDPVAVASVMHDDVVKASWLPVNDRSALTAHLHSRIVDAASGNAAVKPIMLTPSGETRVL